MVVGEKDGPYATKSPDSSSRYRHPFPSPVPPTFFSFLPFFPFPPSPHHPRPSHDPHPPQEEEEGRRSEPPPPPPSTWRTRTP